MKRKMRMAHTPEEFMKQINFIRLIQTHTVASSQARKDLDALYLEWDKRQVA